MSEDVDTALPRETGEQKSTVECPRCGTELPVVRSDYGSTAPGACPQCWPEAESKDGEGSKPETQLDAQKAAADAIPSPASEHAGN